MPETWTLTSVASSKKELYDLMSALRGNTSHVRPYERRGGVCGVFDLIVDGLTDRERQDMTERMTLLGLRKITEEERRAIEAELLLPGQVPSASPAPLSPVPLPSAPPPA